MHVFLSASIFFSNCSQWRESVCWHHAASSSTNLVHLQAMQLTLASYPSTSSTNFDRIDRKFAKENAKQVGHLSPVNNLTVTAAGLRPPHVTNPSCSVCFVRCLVPCLGLEFTCGRCRPFRLLPNKLRILIGAAYPNVAVQLARSNWGQTQLSWILRAAGAFQPTIVRLDCFAVVWVRDFLGPGISSKNWYC